MQSVFARLNRRTRVVIRRSFDSILFLLLLAGVMAGFRGHDAPGSLAPSASYSSGVLQVDIPHDSLRLGNGTLTVDVLAPDDRVLAHSERTVKVTAGQQQWHERLELTQPLAIEDLVWQRLRYSFTYAGTQTAALERIESISRLVRIPIVHVIGQTSYLAGGPAALRLIVTDPGNQVVSSGTAHIDLVAGERHTPLYNGALDRRGTADAQFVIPPGLAGADSLQVAVDTPIGSTEFKQPIRVEDKVAILLSTEKPVYQPGQIIHIRALALDRVNHHASADHKLAFEIEDSRGNKVFKKATQTDQFGVASGEFGLADEVNFGTYHLRATLLDPNEQSHNSAEIALNVDRYVLPRFKVAIDLTDKSGSGKRGYRPGDHVTGTVRANYFFGKPVDGGDVTLKASASDVEVFDAASTSGKTDANGDYRFDITLPKYFAGRPLTQGVARVLLQATVKDNSGHSELSGQPIIVSDSPLLITAVPEGGTLVPGLPNQVFLISSYPDGTPAKSRIRVHSRRNADETVSTDDGGVAIVQLLPASADTPLQVDATDEHGEHASASLTLQSRVAADQILLRTERAIYRVGDHVHLSVFSTKQRGAAYVDVIKEGQTIATRDIDIVNGQASLDFAATPELSGTVEFNAYLFGQDSRPIGDHRLVFVQPADELKVQTTLDSGVYKPGGEARIAFHVTNCKGQDVAAALGLQIVDEAVFALAEKQPGFAKVFFYLEQEAMKPRYEIHSLELRDAIEPFDPLQAARQVRAARALFAATDLVRTTAVVTDYDGNLLAAKQWQYRAQYQRQFAKQCSEVADKISAVLHEKSGIDGVTDVAALVSNAAETTLRDPWGEKVRVDATRSGSNVVRVRSAGPDHAFNTPDDIVASLLVHYKQNSQTIEVLPDVRALFRSTAGMAGGVIGGAINGALVPPPPVVPAPAVRQFVVDGLSVADSNGLANIAPVQARIAAPAPHVRSYFPEALYINPEIITDRTGRATITVPVADSITTWRMAMLASTAQGALGNSTGSLKVFQDFFVDLDLPVTLTQGDCVSIPVAIYNYSGSAGKVALQLQPEDWFSLSSDTGKKSVDVAAGKVGGSQFTIEAKRIGKFKLTLQAQLAGATRRADIVVREIEVVPDGREQNVAFNGRLESSIAQNVNFPAASIPDARTIFVRLYPGPLSQVIEGMDGLLQMPSGCFEQTSSATYPNVLALDYMKRTKKLTPEVHAKAEGFVSTGYQRLLTFEVPGGGFSWFGQAPANKILTSYGLMEFNDMSKVYEIDNRVITRTQLWLAGQQQSDGSWKPDTQFINEGATTRYNSDVLRITAYIAWALENSGFQGPAVENAKHFIEGHLNDKADAYTLAVLANFAVDYRKDPALTAEVMKLLLDARKDDGEQTSWSVEETGVFARGKSAAVETTGLAVQALIESGQNAAIARKAMNFLVAAKDASGTWGTTQATITALRALLISVDKGAAAKGSIEIVLNGKPVQYLELTPDNNDLLHEFALKNENAQTANAIQVRFNGEGSLAYQISGKYFLPWTEKPKNEPLSIDVKYDRTHLQQNDIATATATIRSSIDAISKMVMVDLGIPPGFDLLSEDLQSYQEKSAHSPDGRLEKFNLTATQAILYFDAIAPHDALTISYRLRAKYPIRARTFASRVYEYYNPEVSSVAKPFQIEVAKR